MLKWQKKKILEKNYSKLKRELQEDRQLPLILEEQEQPGQIEQEQPESIKIKRTNKALKMTLEFISRLTGRILQSILTVFKAVLYLPVYLVSLVFENFFWIVITIIVSLALTLIANGGDTEKLILAVVSLKEFVLNIIQIFKEG